MKLHFGSPRKHHVSSARRRPPAFDILEDRLVPTGGVTGPQSLVTGTVFRDLDASGLQSTGEIGLADRVVYLDANGNQQLDDAETRTTTDADGRYTLDLDPGVNTIRMVAATNEIGASPVGGSYLVTAQEGFAASGRDFGTLLVNPSAPVPPPTAPSTSVSDADEAFVDDLYRDILGRNAEPAGLAFWASQLESTDRDSVATAIWNSEEHREMQVESYYLSLLGRQFDAAGKDHWVDALMAGAGEIQVMQAFLNSAEYQSSHPTDAEFVTGLYEDLLGRAPDAAGLAAWQQILQTGASRTNVIDGFLLSPESLDRLVDSFYAKYLNRQPDAEGGAAWVSQLLENRDIEDTAIGILSSLENYFPGAGGGLGEVDTKATNPIMPKSTVASASDVLWYDESAQLNQITFTNNSDNTVYPIVSGKNALTTKIDDPWYGTPIYDPFDNLNQEYRAYIGYTDTNGVNYLGLQPHQTITINVPLVFWNGARIIIASSPDNLTPATDAAVNPFHFHWTNIQEQFTASTTAGSKVLSFTQNHGQPNHVTPPTLSVGMAVSGPGVPAGTVIESLGGPNGYSITLSNPITNLAPAALTNQDYTFKRATTDDPAHATARWIDPSIAAAGSITNGKVMWYHAQYPEEPGNDAQTQLLEMTFRDPYLNTLPTATRPITPSTPKLVPDSERLKLINYDVSYVDSITLPVAMAARDVPVLNNPSVVLPFGWIGSSEKSVQSAMTDFVATNTATDPNKNGLGQYFGGNGYPSYYMPDSLLASAGYKLPSGQNLLMESPYRNQRSAYDQNHFTLTSGAGADTLHIGTANNPGAGLVNHKDQDFLLLDTNDTHMPLLIALVKAVNDRHETYTVVANGEDYILPGTTVTHVEVDLFGEPTGKVLLSQATKPGVEPSSSSVFDFSKPVTDYASDRLMNLWYSWANYYVTHLPGARTLDMEGEVVAGSREIKVGEVPAEVAVGSAVTSEDGLLAPGTTIVRIDRATGTIFLSTVALGGAAGETSGFLCAVPTLSALKGSDDVRIGTLATFTDFGDNPKVDPLLFSQKIYQVMSAMSAVPEVNNALDVLTFVIGCLVGKVTNINNTISNEIRDMTKSLLRGVVDFIAEPESTGNWYPDPSVPTGGQNYNIFNLDPFVWFVHKKLGLSGYGFSVDDDVADVGAFGASKLDVAIGGLGELGAPGALPQKAEWTFGAPYGPIVVTGSLREINPPPPGVPEGLNTIALLESEYSKFWQVFPTDAANGFVGALVSGEGVTPGTRFAFRNEANNGIVLDHAFPDENVEGRPVFALYGPVGAYGSVAAETPTVITGLNAGVLEQLKAIMVPGAKIRVTSPGVPEGTRIVNITPEGNVELNHELNPTTLARFTFS